MLKWIGYNTDITQIMVITVIFSIRQNMLTTQEIIEKLDLVPHPSEGGYLKIVHNDTVTIPNSVLPDLVDVEEERTICDAIYYLIDNDNHSELHRTAGNMLYHFYYGDAVEMLLLHPEGTTPRTERIIFGNDIAAGQQPMKLIPGGSWMGIQVVNPGKLALMGVTMSPGFNPSDYTMGQRAELLAQYPEEKELITTLTD